MADSKSTTPAMLNVAENNLRNVRKSNITPLMFNLNLNNEMPRAVRNAASNASRKTAAVAKSRASRMTRRSSVMPPINAEVLGEGGYGIAFRPALNRPLINANHSTLPANNITKLYFNNNSRNSAVNLARRVQNIIGTPENFRVNAYQSPIFSKNLPPSVAQRIKTSRPGMFRTKSSYKMTRQPFLGFSLDNLSYKDRTPEVRNKMINDIRAIPLYTLFQQIYKLYSQVFTLNQNGYVHGDLHPGNIMINPEKQTMTMIDFDLLNTFEDFYDGFKSELGRAIWPVELIQEPFIGKTYRSNDEYPEERYAHENFYFFGPYWKAMRVTGAASLTSLVHMSSSKNRDAIEDLVNHAYEGNALVALIFGIIPHIDMYSLSLSMLSFLATIMGDRYIRSTTVAEILPIIQTIYPSEPKPEVIANIMLQFRKIMMSLCLFDMESRTMPDTALAMMKNTIDEYVTRGGKNKRVTRRAKKRTSN